MSLELQIYLIEEDIYLFVSGRMESLESLKVGCNSGHDLLVAGLADLLTLSLHHSKYVRDVSAIVKARQVFDLERDGAAMESTLSLFHGVPDLDQVLRTELLELVQVLACVRLLCKRELGRERKQVSVIAETFGDLLIELVPRILQCFL